MVLFGCWMWLLAPGKTWITVLLKLIFRKKIWTSEDEGSIQLSYSATMWICLSCSCRLPAVVWVIKCSKLWWAGHLACILHNKEDFLYKWHDIVRMVTCRRLRWAGYVARVGRQGMWKWYSTSLRLKFRQKEIAKRHSDLLCGFVMFRAVQGPCLVSDCCIVGVGSSYKINVLYNEQVFLVVL